jgi:hypothetical protein
VPTSLKAFADRLEANRRHGPRDALISEIRSSKHEVRNNDQMSKGENSKQKCPFSSFPPVAP